jgi:DNA-binding MarR family transcriptional regulator
LITLSIYYKWGGRGRKHKAFPTENKEKLKKMEIRKVLKLERGEFYLKHLEIINPFLPVRLTPREIEVLAAFMSLENELSEDRFGTTARKVVRNKLTITPGGLGNYLKSLKQKGFIYKRQGAFQIAGIVMPTDDVQTYSFSLTNYSSILTNA